MSRKEENATFMSAHGFIYLKSADQALIASWDYGYETGGKWLL